METGVSMERILVKAITILPITSTAGKGKVDGFLLERCHEDTRKNESECSFIQCPV